MTNSERLLAKIDSFYNKGDSYASLKNNHLSWINLLSLVAVDLVLDPELGQRVFAVQDLTPLGKGKFISDYYYTEYGFVANMDDEDGYGFITRCISFDDIDKLENFVV
jgi:hypothetical protein